MRAVFLIVALTISYPSAVAQQAAPSTPEEMHRLHQDAGAYIALLEDPARDGYQKPHEVIAALQIEEGEFIADIGAGSGYFTLRLARHVGDKGRIYAVDVNPDMILHLNRRIRDLGVRNVQTILAAPDDPLLADGSLDRVFICDTWHHIPDQARYLSLLKKLLKRGGQIVMIDYQRRELPVGPPVSMKIAREDLLRQMKDGGFRLAQEHDFLPYQYFLVFEAQ